MNLAILKHHLHYFHMGYSECCRVMQTLTLFTLIMPPADLSDPPDLYASLNDEQVPPPPEDMNPGETQIKYHMEQELRFDGDLYTPRWVRGHGNKREGWCGICKPGRWLVLQQRILV